MTSNLRRFFYNTYAIIFLLYLLVPLAVMAGAAFNVSRFPSIVPWQGFTLKWFAELADDPDLLQACINTLVVAAAVVVMAVPIGTAGAILVNSLKGRSRTLLYAAMIAPVLTPGAVIGISTLLFWYRFGVPAGLHLSALGQTSFIASYVMLMVLARLQSFDGALEEAALDLGASHPQMMRRILLPHLYPSIAAGAVLAFFQSLENFNTTKFTRGSSNTLTVYIGSKVRTGITPSINALALIMIVITIVGALVYELRRRQVARRAALFAAAED
jgi:spermidine/putrescine transport system permease protein